MSCLKLDLKNLLTDNVRFISGLGDGEKIVLSQNFDHLLLLCNNFVSAGKIKKGLEGFGKKIDIVSNARESNDENDKNLMSFIESINKYLMGEIDGIIFLPCSSIIKFDLDKFTTFKVSVGDTMPISSFIERLVAMGYERVPLVEESGQFALRGDILDIFMPSQENPVRIEFFDEEV